MAAGNEEISLFEIARRFARIILAPGALGALRTVNTATGDELQSLGLMLERNAEAFAGRVAIKCGDSSWTWAEVNAWSNRYANYLSTRGIGMGDVVGINIGNRTESLISLFAVAKLGGISALLNTSQTGARLAHSLTLTKPKLVVVGEEQVMAMASVRELLDSTLKGKLLYVADGSNTPAPPGYLDLASASSQSSIANPGSAEKIRARTPAYYIFTSGTTGMPKASITTHLRLYRSAAAAGKLVLRLTPDDVIYCTLPFYHSNSVVGALTACLGAGCSMAIGRKFSASGFWDDCRRYNATTFYYIGEMLRYLLSQPASDADQSHTVTRILGNGLRPDIWDEFKQRFGIDRVYEFYGASEGNQAFINIFNFDKTCGCSPGTRWDIVEYDVDADQPIRNRKGWLRPVPKGGTGLMMIEVTTRNPYDGYTDPVESEKKLLRNVFRKGDCWFNSGDLLRKQGWGHVQFVDRIGDTFRWHGENVATTEVEAAIHEWSQTEDAVVYGVQVPNCEGRCGMVAYTISGSESLNLKGFAKHLRSSLPPYAVPRFLRLQERTQITETFKYQKSTLKQEGYDPEVIKSPLYFLARDSEAWVSLTPELKKEIDAGRLRL